MGLSISFRSSGDNGPHWVEGAMGKGVKGAKGLSGEADGTHAKYRPQRHVGMLGGGKTKRIPASCPEVICVFAQRSTGNSWWVWVCAQLVQSVDTRLVLRQHAGGESNQNCLILQLANCEAG